MTPFSSRRFLIRSFCPKSSTRIRAVYPRLSCNALLSNPLMLKITFEARQRKIVPMDITMDKSASLLFRLQRKQKLRSFALLIVRFFLLFFVNVPNSTRNTENNEIARKNAATPATDR